MSTTPFLGESPGLWSLRGHKAPPLDKTLGCKETAGRCGGSNVALNPREIAAGGVSWRSSSSQILSALRLLMASEASAAGKECHPLSDTLKSNNNWLRKVLGLCWSQGWSDRRTESHHAGAGVQECSLQPCHLFEFKANMTCLGSGGTT